MSIGTARFNDLDVSMRVTFASADSAEQEFRRLASLVELDPDDFGRTFHANEHRFTISGVNLRAKRFPILATREDGKTFKFTSRGVHAALKAEGVS